MRWNLLAYSLAPLAFLTAAGSAAEHLSKDQATQMVLQLGSRHFGEREAASRALDALGADALPALQEAVHSPDLEVRRRALTLTEQIGQRLERDHLLTTPRVHLVFHDRSVSDALAEFKRKTGLNVKFQGDLAALANRRLTLDTGNVSVWEALHQICRKAALYEARPQSGALGRMTARGSVIERAAVVRGGAVMYTTTYRNQPNSRARLVLVDHRTDPLPTTCLGALRIRALPPRAGVANRALSAGEKALGLEVSTDPRLMCERVLRVRIDRAVDEHGCPLAQITRTNTHRNPRDPFRSRVYTRSYGTIHGDTLYVPFRLAATKETGSRLKELRGVLSLEVQTPAQAVVTIDHILKAGGKEQAGGGAQLKIISVEPQKDGQVKVHVQLTTPLTDGNELRRAVILRRRALMRARLNDMNSTGDEENPLILVDAKGKHFSHVGVPQFLAISTNMGGTMTQELELTYQPQKGQSEAAKLIYRAPRHIAIDVPFTLKNVPLP